MKGEKRQPTAATARHSLPNAEAANKRLPQPPSTPAATNKRSTRHSTTIQPLDTRQPKVRKTAQTPQLSSQRDEEHKEAEEDETSDASLSALCSLVNSLATLHSQSLSDHDIITSRYQSLLSALHRLSPPTSLSPRHPPSSAVSTAVRSAAEELITVARALQTTIPSSPLLHSQLLQLHSALLPLPASDVYALLLSSSVTLCQLLARSSTSRSSRLQVRRVAAHTQHHSVSSHLNLRAVAATVRLSLNRWEECKAPLSTAS